MTSPGQLSRLQCGRAESGIRNKPDLIMTVNGHVDKGDERSPVGGCSSPGPAPEQIQRNARAAGYVLPAGPSAALS
jgi:hypothetical protein